jgi:hypothetical protein
MSRSSFEFYVGTRHVLRLAERFTQSMQRSITTPAIQLLVKVIIYSFPIHKDYLTKFHDFIMCAFSD